MANTVTSLFDYEVNQETGEIQSSASIAEAQSEIQNAIFIARKFPRNEDEAYSKLMKSCLRKSFAERVSYRYPRGNAEIVGPSVHVAREAARLWGNIRHGVNIVSDDKHKRTLEGWAWDIESNTKVTSQVTFEKLIFRKGKGWIAPDERDLRELTNKHAAIAKRNCILEILPKDLIEDAQAEAFNTIKKEISADPSEAKKKVIKAFAAYNISAEMLAEYLEHSLDTLSVDEIADLRTMLQSIKDGNTTWKDYVKKPEENSVNDETKSKFSAKKQPETKQEEPEKPKEDITIQDVFSAVNGRKKQFEHAAKRDIKRDEEFISMLEGVFKKEYEGKLLIPSTDTEWEELIEKFGKLYG